MKEEEQLPEGLVKWLASGRRGVSSNTMVQVMTGIKALTDNYKSHPRDPSDFNRCHKLLEAVPALRFKLHLMKDESKAWSNLVDNWDKLTEMLLEERPTSARPEMFELMEKLTWKV